VSLGSVSAYYQRRIPDKLVRALVSVGQACPEFLFGALLIFVFFYVFQIAPAPIGQHAFADALVPRRTGATVVDALLAGDWATFRSGLRYLVLPVLTGAMPLTVIFAKTTRAVLAEALEGPAAEYARANALSEGLVVRWALKQVRTPLITYVGILVPLLIGGGAIVEILYSWNGLGQYAVQSIQELDVPVIQAYVLFVSLISLISYIVLDVVVVMLDPRLSRT
jgi:ABC-type dipeptide/oligopeptide/nickel transport system permease component